MLFRRKTPQILVVDDFFEHPDEVRRLALDQEYERDGRYFKGERSKQKFLFPYLKEEFERLLGVRITDWMQQPANGSFQKTTFNDPLVYHSDTQDYAAAIYLTPNPPFMLGSGTSFWMDRDFNQRRPSRDAHVNAQIYSEYNLTHPDEWLLIDRVEGIYNRLVLWDGQLIHSATSYDGFTEENPRLVQLFFFSVSK